MELFGFFDIGEQLLSALVDVGTFIYEIFFTPLRDSIVAFDLPFVGTLLQFVPPEVWETFLGDMSLVGLFISSGVVLYVVLFLFNLLLQFIDILT